jgi:DNA-binding PucR family transcriptional regulator
LQLLRTRLTDQKVATFDQLRAHALLLNLQQASSLRCLLEAGKVAALQRLDRRHGTTYVQTLTAYLDWFGDLNAAAESIHIHRNTLRYRLRKLCELVALDLTDSTERLVCHLELRLLEGDPGLDASAAARNHEGGRPEDWLYVDVGATSEDHPHTNRSRGARL